MLDPRQAFSNAEHYMAIGRAFRERKQPALIEAANVIRFPIEHVREPQR